jgi:zinc protease
MRKFLAAIILLASLASFQAWSVPAAGSGKIRTPHETLPNGLEVIVVENDAVPLVTVCVAFRGGASAQAPETAGLFHLYEHMLFDGNEKYRSQAEFMAALNRLGVSTWNGATGTEYINYFVTLPSEKLAEGIEFWSWAVRKPVFEEDKLEREKQVVINEIRGYHVDPAHIADEGLESRMFADYPWRKNIDGPEETVQGATIEQLERMRAAYYIPRNTALLVGGDVKADEVFALAKKYFGDWQGGPAPVIADPPHGKLPPGLSLVYPDDDYYQGIAQSQIRWRGPDALAQTADTYVADVFGFLLSSPVGRFKTALMRSGLGLYDPEYIDFGYPTSRDGGEFRFSALLLAKGGADEGNILDRNEKLRAFVVSELAEIAKDPAAYFGAEALEKAKAKLIDQNILAGEVASSYVTSTLTFWWSVASADYFFGYEENCHKVSWSDISSLVKRYLLGTNSAALVRIRSDAYASDPKAAEREKTLGYAEIGPDNAFWWQRKGERK